MKTPSVGIIHTSPATVEIFGREISKLAPYLRVVNIVDDSILPDVADNGGDISIVRERWLRYIEVLRSRPVHAILNACSSIGELCSAAPQLDDCPVIRVDESMARWAVLRGRRIAVIATLPTTLGPTKRLLNLTAKRLGRDIEVFSCLADGAYQTLLLGDVAKHDQLVRDRIKEMDEQADLIILAQASMSRAANRIEGDIEDKIVSSPSFAAEEIVKRVNRVNHNN